MRIHRIDVEGFGPFRTRQSIDLDAYADDGIFLISGRTGTGKSSILDAVCFALYGTTPRYDDTEKRLRSDHAQPGEPTEVAVEFTVGDRMWRIERSPGYPRPKKRGEGMTTADPSVEMYERIDGEWQGRAAREREVSHLVGEVVGLNQQQFLQVILLAQGRFARFLLAKNDERQVLLRTLFGTRRFEEYETSLDDRRRAAQAAAAEQTQTLRLILDQAADDIAAVERRVADGNESAPPSDAAPAPSVEHDIARLTAAADHAEGLETAVTQKEAALRAARDDVEKARDERRAVHEQQTRRNLARARIKQLDLAAAATDTVRAELAAARRAETVRPAIDAADRAHEAAETAAETAHAARSAWVEALADVRTQRGDAEGIPLPAEDAEPEILDGFAADVQRLIGGWEPLRQQETQLAQRADDIERQREHLATLETRAYDIEAQRNALPERIDSVNNDISRATERASRREAAQKHISDLEAQFSALNEVKRLSTSYAQAVRAASAAVEARAAAEHHLNQLHARRIAGIAGEIADVLVAGEPCAVCGSTEHPAPAPRSDDPVTPEQIDAADTARATAAGEADQAQTARQQAELSLRDAENRAGGRTEVEISGDLLAAQKQKDDAEAALREKSALERQRDDLADAEKRLEREGRDIASQGGTLRGKIEEIAATWEKDNAAVQSARGAFSSVAARIGVAQRLASRATVCSDSHREADRSRVAARTAAEAREQVLRDNAFVSVDDARAASRPAAEREQMEQQLAQAEADRAAAQQTITETAHLPAELVDLDSVEQALLAAREQHETAVDARSGAQHLTRALRNAAARAEQVHARIADALRRATVVTRLADTVAGRPPNTKRMNLETFVLAAELEEIVEAANVRLAEMSAGRYSLLHSDALARRGAASGLGIEVMDSYTGQARPPHSLSGGETFLASLALALGLAEVVTGRAGGIRLDTLFIDEGFGSLDGETLETAMRTLDELRQGGRTVGIISHVDAMKEQIPAQLRVRHTREGWSIVEQDTPTRSAP
ncbi:AAA family ATPase [Microbacterium amylolyticum]|uniref:Nuclease SbcCD subunit C n=1 Tax=Microbacterium amylolyticum TaxID=936337 RepID=A0ABS4ZJ59_9MICO|nr:SMC family ATPase [Microbacterium amylolyticum]MBP2437304.1 exonuclease SbcC [Microbacterium amylolyticum]